VVYVKQGRNRINKRIGLLWARLMAIYGQLGFIQGILNSLMLIAVTYTTTLQQRGVPLWVYLAILVLILSLATVFILFIGIRGYYDFFNEQSNLDKLEKKLDAFIEEWRKGVK
jgi:cell division protein FtsW (lipid II flippase)